MRPLVFCAAVASLSACTLILGDRPGELGDAGTGDAGVGDGREVRVRDRPVDEVAAELHADLAQRRLPQLVLIGPHETGPSPDLDVGGRPADEIGAGAFAADGTSPVPREAHAGAADVDLPFATHRVARHGRETAETEGRRHLVGIDPAGAYPHAARAALIAEYMLREGVEIPDREVARHFFAALWAPPAIAYEGAAAPDFTAYWERPLVPSYMGRADRPR